MIRDSVALSRQVRHVVVETPRKSHILPLPDAASKPSAAAPTPAHAAPAPPNEAREKPSPSGGAGALFGPREKRSGPPKPSPGPNPFSWLFEALEAKPDIRTDVQRARLFLIGVSDPQSEAERAWIHDTPWERLERPPGGFLAPGPIALNARCTILRQILGAPGSRRTPTPLFRARVLVVVFEPEDPAVLYVTEALAATLRRLWLHLTVSFVHVTAETGKTEATRKPVRRRRGPRPRVVTRREWSQMEMKRARGGVRSRFDVLHVIGHGTRDVDGGEAGISLKGDEPLRAGDLERHLAGSRLRLAVFNVCSASRSDARVDFGRTSIVESVADFVVAPAQPQHCLHAAAFNDALYSALADGHSVPMAVTAGRIAIRGERPADEAAAWFANEWVPSVTREPAREVAPPRSPKSAPTEPEWWLPILYTRHTIHDRALWRRLFQPLRWLIVGLMVAAFGILAHLVAERANDAAVLTPAPHFTEDETTWLLFRERSFGIDRHEVTVAEYEQCVREGGCVDLPRAATVAESRAMRMNYGDQERSTHPVNYVTATEADGYCAHARRHGVAGRLPTKEEYRLAAGGQSGILPGKSARRYCWGNFPEPTCEPGPGAVHMRSARGGGCGSTSTAPATDDRYEGGRTPEGVWGLCGNVWEWLAPDDNDADGDRQNTGAGYWDSEPLSFETDYRETDPSDSRDPEIGFRCAYDVPDDLRRRFQALTAGDR